MELAARTAAWAQSDGGRDLGPFQEIVDILHSSSSVEAAKEKLIGKVIEDTWVDLDGSGSGDATPSQDAAGHPIWLDPMICTNVEMAEGADGNQHLTAIMMRQYATAKTIQFDPMNHDEATEEFAQDGITYYGSTTAGKTSVSDVTVLSLAPGDPVPYPSYTKVYRNSVNDSTKGIVVNGYNRYQYSSWRQYLNASKTAGKGTWWTKQRVGQVAPNYGDYDIHPYQAGCSDALLAAIKPIKRTVVANTKTDGGGTYQICDQFWLPAHVEMFGETDTTEGLTQEEYWHYISGDLTKTPSMSAWEPRKQYRVDAKSVAVYVFLRSTYASNSSGVLCINNSGGFPGLGSSARITRAGVPTCAIY